MASRKVQTLKYGLDFFAYTCTFLGEWKCCIIIIVIVCLIVHMRSIMLLLQMVCGVILVIP